MFRSSFNISGHVGAGSAAIAAAAAQAVTSTYQQNQGRRGQQASLKASVATAMKAEQLSKEVTSLVSMNVSFARNSSFSTTDFLQDKPR